jgi:hypothetical protein
MNGWYVADYKLPTVSAVGASVTNSPISKEFSLSQCAATRAFVVKIKVTGVTLATAITAKLQSGIDGEYVDSKTVSITADGNFYIKLLAAAAADQTFFPLLNTARVVITTGAGDAVTISKVQVLQE